MMTEEDSHSSCLTRYKGHIALVAYFLLFGIIFLTFSILYLVQLCKIDVDPLPECVQGLLTPDNNNDYAKNGQENGTNQTTGQLIDNNPFADCADVTGWKIIGWVGVAYGSLCLLAGFMNFWPFFKLLWLNCRGHRRTTTIVKRTESSRSRSSNSPRGGRWSSLTAASGGRTIHRCIRKKKRPRQTGMEKRRGQSGEVEPGTLETPPLSSSTSSPSWSPFTKICLKFVFIVVLWLSSVVMPWYIAVNIYTTSGIRAMSDRFYVPALGLFVTSVVNLAILAASCIFMAIEDTHDFWEREGELLEEEGQTTRVISEELEEVPHDEVNKCGEDGGVMAEKCCKGGGGDDEDKINLEQEKKPLNQSPKRR